MTLPIIEQLARMETDAERARWLLCCPFSVLVQHQDDIAGVLRAAGFYTGLKCLSAELVLLASVRDGDHGAMALGPTIAANIARRDMMDAVRRGRNG